MVAPARQTFITSTRVTQRGSAGGEEEMADAIRRLDAIDPHACRRSASERFDVAAVAAGYEEGYHEVVSLDGAARNPGDPHPRVADPSVVLPRIDVS